RAFIRDEIAEAVGGPVMLMSGVSREGTTDVLRALQAQIDEGRARSQISLEESRPWQP
ncbi:MAG: GTPase ObgE, partial [Pseudomonadota bacterium]